MKKFLDYLYGNQFTVITDSNPLTYLLILAKIDAISYRGCQGNKIRMQTGYHGALMVS